MRRSYPQYAATFRILRDGLPHIYQFSHHSELNIPRTSNRIENFMEGLQQRLKTMPGAKTPQTLEGYINELVLMKSKVPTNELNSAWCCVVKPRKGRYHSRNEEVSILNVHAVQY